MTQPWWAQWRGKGPPARDGLGSLVLVVRENEIDPPAVQVEPLAQKVERHDHALGVPAGPTGTERRVPARLARFGLLPEREVDRRALLRVHLDTRTRLERVERLVGEQSVAVDLLDAQVHPRRGLVRETPIDQVGDQAHHRLDVLGGVRHVVGPQDPEGVGGLPPRPFELVGDLGLGPALGGGPGDDLVVDVGHIRDVVHFQPAEDQVSPQDVEDEPSPAVADVGHLIDGEAARVKRNVPRVTKCERPHGARGRVVEPQHEGTVTRS